MPTSHTIQSAFWAVCLVPTVGAEENRLESQGPVWELGDPRVTMGGPSFIYMLLYIFFLYISLTLFYISNQ